MTSTLRTVVRSAVRSTSMPTLALGARQVDRAEVRQPTTTIERVPSSYAHASIAELQEPGEQLRRETVGRPLAVMPNQNEWSQEAGISPPAFAQ
jgi:hypothetical protein